MTQPRGITALIPTSRPDAPLTDAAAHGVLVDQALVDCIATLLDHVAAGSPPSPGTRRLASTLADLLRAEVPHA